MECYKCFISEFQFEISNHCLKCLCPTQLPQAPLVYEDNMAPDAYADSDEEGTDGYRKGGYHKVKVGEIYNERYKVKNQSIDLNITFICGCLLL